MLWRWLSYADVEDVTASNNKTTKIRGWVSAAEFPSTVKYDVHVAVAVYHFATVLGVVLQTD